MSSYFAKLLVVGELGEERGKLGDGKLLGAGVWANTERCEGCTNLLALGNRPKVVDQRFAFLRERQFHKI